jgi:hypothetical protein
MCIAVRGLEADKAEVDDLLKVCAMKPAEARCFRMVLGRIGQKIALADDPSGESGGHDLTGRDRAFPSDEGDGLHKPDL